MRAKSEGYLNNVRPERNVDVRRSRSSQFSEQNLVDEGYIQVLEVSVKPSTVNVKHSSCFMFRSNQNILHLKRREIHNTFVGYLLQSESANHKLRHFDEDAIWDRLLQ